MRIPLIFCLFWLAGIGYAQHKVSGKILDENGDPVPFANITLHTLENGTLIKGLISNENGTFEAEVLEDNYLLKVSLLGYRPFEKELSNGGYSGDIVLEPQAEELEGVVVAAEKPFIQRQQDRLVVNVENSVVNVGNSSMEILEKSPGIVVDQDGNLSMNGRSGVRVYMDGKDTRLQGEDLANLLRTMPASNIEKIELITNPSVKYEAQGNAGIINIVTKKGRLYGTNGSISLTPGHGRYFRWENSLNFNHRTERVNLFGQYSFVKRNQWQKITIDRAFLNEDGNVLASYTLDNLFELPIESHAPRIGLDYTINESTTLGVLITGLVNINITDAFNDINQFDPQGSLISRLNTDTDVDSRWNQVTGNINLKHRFNPRSSLDFDFDIAKYKNQSDQRYDSDFFDAGGSPIGEDLLVGDVEGYLDLAGLSLDYQYQFASGNEFSAGWKNTWVKTDNDLRYFNQIGSDLIPNEQLTNRFIYHEEIYGAYLNYSVNKEDWNAQFGLRSEYTAITGDQITTGDSFSRNYLEFFPSASFNYTPGENHGIGISLSRRIDRPSYSQLNPFRFFVDINTFREGNPFLNPQFTWNGELNYTLKKKYYFALSYGYTIDQLNLALLQDGDNQSIVIKPVNIEAQKTWAFVSSFPLQITSWWQSNWNLNFSLNQFEGDIGGFTFNQNNPIYSFNTNHSVNLGEGFKLQLGYFHLFPHYVSTTRIDDISNLSIGFQKSILKNKGTLRLNVNDLLWNQYPQGTTRFGNIDDTFISYRDTRYATLSLTWNFGKQSVQPQRRRNSGVQEELDRARQQQN